MNDRLTDPNGVMAAVQLRMADEVSCQTVAWQLSRPDADRELFQGITPDSEPETVTGDAVPAAIARIKTTIQALHGRILGETLPDGDPEIDRTYQLFYDTWKQGKANVAATTESAWLPWACQANTDPRTGAALADASKLQQDPSYTVRAWMAVVTYLLDDWRFLYD